MRRRIRGVVTSAILLLVSLASAAATTAHADNAPMWDSPEGLAPASNTHVQMAAEEVQVQVQEKAGGIVADVAATFDMLNTGPTAQMLVGFPNFAGDALPTDQFSPVTFGHITNFRAWTDNTTYTPADRKVSTGSYGGSTWFVWTMTYPSGKPTRVQVAYEQALGNQGSVTWAPVSYVLRTGALWDGPIGHAKVTMTAPGGGGLVPILPPSSSGDSQLTWTWDNFKPTQDVEAAFIVADSWRALQAAQAAAAAPDASADNLVSSANAVLNVFTNPAQDRVFQLAVERRYSTVFADRYLPLVQSWADRAVQVDQSNADAWELVGDLQQALVMERHGWLTCWPTTAVDAYQQAVDQGSDTAAAKLAEMNTQKDPNTPFGGMLDDCGG